MSAFVRVCGAKIAWAIPAARVVRIVREAPAAQLELLPLDAELAPATSDDESAQLVVLRHPDGEQALRLYGRLEITKAEGLTIVPLPELCRPTEQAALVITAVAISEDEVRFLIAEPAACASAQHVGKAQELAGQ